DLGELESISYNRGSETELVLNSDIVIHDMEEDDFIDDNDLDRDDKINDYIEESEEELELWPLLRPHIMEEMRVEIPHHTHLGFLPRQKLDSLLPSERLPVRIDKKGDMWRAIKVNQKYFSRHIGVLFRKNRELFHKNWAKVPAEQKAKIELGVRQCFEYKDISNEELPRVYESIDRSAQDMYKD
ncbi:hypothetical protein TorRG33x02_088450, partial [Trema orientale]